MPNLRTASRLGVLLLLVACLVGGLFGPAEQVVSAQPTDALPPELQIVPIDAALFLHADAAKLWSGPIAKSLRTVDPKTFDDLTANAKSLFGVAPESLKSAAAFWPKFKGPPDLQSFGVVLTFNAPVDLAKLKAGIEQIAPQGTKFSVHSPADRVAVVLVGLGEEYAKPRPTNKTGPLTATIREAATGKHVLVAGTTLANLPDEIRGDDVPRDILPFKSLLAAETITGLVGLDKELSIQVRVKAPTPPRAAEAEKALGLLVQLMQGGLGEAERELGKGGGDKDPATRDIFTILKALQGGLKDAKFSTEGEVARVSVKVSADLPFANAYLAAQVKVRAAAARAQSSNNLKQIAIAMHSYADSNTGNFPPAAVCDKTGKPMLSWRVLILPYIEADNLYKEFKLDEPWDSEHNKKLIPKMPKVYGMPIPTKAKAGETHYRVFVGKGASFDYLKGARLPQDFPDGTSNTILAVTAADAVPWTKPDELAFDPDKDMRSLLGFIHGGQVCMIALCDGSVRALSKSITQKTLGFAINRNDGEPLGDDF